MHIPGQKVAAIHDLSGFGRASLTVIIPILSRMGIQVCPLPTAVLSTHSKYSDFHFVDLTEQLPPMIEHWKKLNLDFKTIYSGFLGFHRQIEIVQNFIDEFQREDQRLWKVAVNYLPANYPGTGDAFASVITGSLLQGDSLPIALDRAARFTGPGVRATFGYDYNTDQGILLERILDTLVAPVQTNSYEIF